MSANTILEVSGISKNFGGVQALEDVNFEVEQGTITGLIGPNGAGKTTCFNVITGRHEPTSGSVVFKGQEIQDVPEHERVGEGLIRTFQLSRELSGVSVMDNLLMGYQNHPGESAVKGMANTEEVQKAETEARDRAENLLQDLGLWQQRDEYAGNLAGGERKLLEIGRALMAEPDLLLLDEPMAGVNEEDVGAIMDEIRTVRDERGITVLVVEHDMSVIMDISERIIGLVNGTVLTTGTPEEIRNHDEMTEVYLGGG